MEDFHSSKCVKGLEFSLTSMPCYFLFQNSKVIFQPPGLLCYTTATMLTEHAEISKRELIMANRLKGNLTGTIKEKIKKKGKQLQAEVAFLPLQGSLNCITARC